MWDLTPKGNKTIIKKEKLATHLILPPRPKLTLIEFQITPLIKLLVEKYIFWREKKGEKLKERKEKGMEGRKRQGKEEKGGPYKGSFVSCQKLIFVYVAERRGETQVFVASSVSSLHLHFGPFLSPSLLLCSSLWWCLPPAIT